MASRECDADLNILTQYLQTVDQEKLFLFAFTIILMAFKVYFRRKFVELA